MMKIDPACIVSAVLFWISSCFRAAQLRQWHNQPNFHYSTWKSLDATYLEQQWDFRLNHRSLEMVTGFMNALAWFVFAIPIVHVVWLQSLKGKRMISIHIAIALLAIGGAMTELLARVFFIGTSSTMEWMAKDFNLDVWLVENEESTTTTNDGLGWKSLEVTHIAIMGVLTWIDALEYLFLSFIFVFLFLSVWIKSERLFHIRWAYFGIVLAGLCLIDFAADIMRYQNWRRYSQIAFWISSLHRLILFPAWLIWLSFQIPKAEYLLEEMSQPTPQTEKFTNTSMENNSSHLVS